ncbi:MAG: glycosyltransferase family 4 protein [Bacteroidales bacterium]|nr:glycosyltransferase family 4 protein [Bacteroidales bacterium]
MKTILYIGNDLTKKTKYYSAMELLYKSLRSEGYDITVRSNKINRFLRLLDMLQSVIKNRSLTDYILIDTFSTRNFYYALVVSQVARLFKIKYIPILHGGNLPYRLDNNINMSKAIFNNSYKNVAPSNYLKYKFEEKGFITEFIPNILDIKLYAFRQRKILHPNILYVRAFHNIYNPTMAVEVLYEVKKEYPNATLCMIGPAKDESLDKTKQLVEKLGLQKDVIFTGVLWKEDWLKMSEEYDIFINTTNIDNTPVSVMEAMALGLPVVSTNPGGIPYLINDKVDGLLVPKNDIKAMSSAIIYLLRNTKQANNIATHARKKVESFTWEKVKYLWSDLLK